MLDDLIDNVVDFADKAKDVAIKSKSVETRKFATLSYDNWKPKNEADKKLHNNFGFVYNLEITESLCEPFHIQGKVAFNFKRQQMVGKKMRLRLSAGEPDPDIKYWHGIVTQWSYDKKTSKDYYLFEFSMIPEVKYKLSTRRSRIFFPTDDEAQKAHNKEVIFNRKKLMDAITEKLFKDNEITLREKRNGDATKELQGIVDYYKQKREKLYSHFDEGVKYAKEDKNSKLAYVPVRKSIINMQINVVDALHRASVFMNSRSKYLNYEDKTNFQNEKEDFPEYIVQYDETDWEFLQRLCREFGIYYCFEHSESHTGIIFYNNPQGSSNEKPAETAPIAPPKKKIQYGKASSKINVVESTSKKDSYKTYYGYEKVLPMKAGYANPNKVNHLELSDAAAVYDLHDPFTDSRPLHYSNFNKRLNDDRFVTTWKEVFHAVPALPDLYGYNHDYDPDKRNILNDKKNADGHYYDETLTDEQKMKDLRKIHQQYANNNTKEYHTETYRQEVSPGYKFVLVHHPIEKMNGQYYVKRVVHRLEYKNLDERGHDTDEQTDKVDLQYSNEAVFSKIDQPFKLKPKPMRKIMGVQTGIVVGGEDQQIYTNDLGQVKVYFHWDNNRKDLDKGKMLQQAVWIRVAQWGGAGNEWGGFFVPRVGQEVVISFENGNPNYPIIIGCLHNRSNMPNYNLVKTEDVISKTGFKTQSLAKVKDNEKPKFNELVFEDKAGEEEILLHAAKDLKRIVKDSETVEISKNYKETIHSGNREMSFDATDDSDDEKSGNNEEIKQKYATKMKSGDITTEIEKGNYGVTLKEGNISQLITKGNMSQKLEDGNLDLHVKKDVTEKIEGAQTIEIEKDAKLTIKSGNYTISVKGGNVEIEATKIDCKSTGNLTIKSGGNLTLDAGGNLNIKANGNLKLSGTTFEADSKTTAKVKGGAIVQVQGAMVQLN